MIEYIKEYGVTDFDYNRILHQAKLDFIELMALSEVTVRKNLAYYNSLGITVDIANIITMRPDLVLIDTNALMNAVEKIDVELFKNIVKKDIEDLVLLGV